MRSTNKSLTNLQYIERCLSAAWARACLADQRRAARTAAARRALAILRMRRASAARARVALERSRLGLDLTPAAF